MKTNFPTGSPTFGDHVRIRSSAETEQMGVAGQVGQVFGQTTPYMTGVMVIGKLSSDYAINVHFDDRNESFWFAPGLVEFVDYAPGTEIGLDDSSKKWVRMENGEWREEPSESKATKPWWRFWS